MIPLWILGGGGHARVVIDIARSVGLYNLCGVLDDNPETEGAIVAGIPLAGRIDLNRCRELDVHRAVIAIGNASVRKRIANTFGEMLAWEQLRHRHSCVAETAKIGEGTIICAGTIVQPDAAIGAHAILNTACSVDHDCILEQFVQIGPGAHLGGNVTVRTGGFIGIGAAILPGIEIGEWAVVGAGAVVTRNVAPHSTVAGNPARELTHPKGSPGS